MEILTTNESIFILSLMGTNGDKRGLMETIGVLISRGLQVKPLT